MNLNINPNVRNVAIVLVIALLVVAVPGGGTGARTAIQGVSLVFLLSIVWVGTRLYRDNRMSLYSMGDTRRAVLYGAIGAVTVLCTASNRMLNTGGGTIAFIALLLGCAYAVFAVVWSARNY
jgi:hypothetical protein